MGSREVWIEIARPEKVVAGLLEVAARELDVPQVDPRFDEARAVLEGHREPRLGNAELPFGDGPRSCGIEGQRLSRKRHGGRAAPVREADGSANDGTSARADDTEARGRRGSLGRSKTSTRPPSLTHRTGEAKGCAAPLAIAIAVDRAIFELGRDERPSGEHELRARRVAGGKRGVPEGQETRRPRVSSSSSRTRRSSRRSRRRGATRAETRSARPRARPATTCPGAASTCRPAATKRASRAFPSARRAHPRLG